MRSEAGTLLLESGIIDEAKLQMALSVSVSSSQTIVQTLISLGYVEDEELAAFFATRLQIPLAEKSTFLRLPEFITRLIPLDIVMVHRTVPVMLHQGVLHMAMSDPTNREAIEEISFITGYSASPVAAPDSLLEQAMEKYYGIPPDSRTHEILQVSNDAKSTMPAELPFAPQVPVKAHASHFEATPGPLPENALAQAEGVQTKKLPEQQQTSDRAEMLIEPASGELEELFGLSSKDQEIIHLTKAKKSTTISSINDAIVKKVQSVLDTSAPHEKPRPVAEDNTVKTKPISSSEEESPDDDFPPLKDAAEAKYLLENAKDRDEIASTLVQFSRTFMKRVVLFIIKKDMLVGWMGAGSGIRKNQVKGILLPLGSPSVFRTVKETQTDYFGSMPRTSTNEMFLASLGELRPRQALLIPITVRQKAICILYGDCGSQPGFRKDLSNVHLLALDASKAFERLIMEKKFSRLVKK